MKKSRLDVSATGRPGGRSVLAIAVGIALASPAPAEPAAAEVGLVASAGRSLHMPGFFDDVRPPSGRGAVIDPAKLAAELRDSNAKEARASFGTRFDNGLELAFSAAHVVSGGVDALSESGPDLVPLAGSGMDYEGATRMHGRAGFGPFRFTATHAERNKGLLGGFPGTAFDDTMRSAIDKSTAVNLTHTREVRQFALTTRVFRGTYGFRGDELFPAALQTDGGEGDWWGIELKAVGAVFQRHTLTLGGEYQHSVRTVRPAAAEAERRAYAGHSQALAVYAEDEYEWRSDLSVTGGIRYDDPTTDGRPVVSPRVGLTYKATPQSTAKLLYAEAVRNPRIYGSSALFSALQIGSPDLRAEHVRSAEASLEHRPRGDLKLKATFFASSIDSAIRQITHAETGLLRLENQPEFEARGAEVAIEGRAFARTKIRASYTLQSVASARGFGEAPRDVARLNLSGPLPGARLTAALEAQYTAPRETSLGEVGGLGVANLTLRYRARSAPVELSAWTYNLFDRRYADPVGFDGGMPPGDPFEQGGRTVGLQAVLWL